MRGGFERRRRLLGTEKQGLQRPTLALNINHGTRLILPPHMDSIARLEDGLILRRGTAADAGELAAFNTQGRR